VEAGVVVGVALGVSAGVAVSAKNFSTSAASLSGRSMCTWWLVLSTGVWAVRHAISDRAMVIVNRISGGLLMAFGVFAIASGVRG
jgi:threonine/homoserine/homoserine lactone efflux protein